MCIRDSAGIGVKIHIQVGNKRGRVVGGSKGIGSRGINIITENEGIGHRLIAPDFTGVFQGDIRQAVRGVVDPVSYTHLPGVFRAGDVLVLNNSRVIPARLRGANARTGGKFEILLLEEKATNDWWVMLRPGKSARVGTQIVFHGNRQITRIRATVVEMCIRDSLKAD